jgi:adenylyl- and sulfurtransferase ThiI
LWLNLEKACTKQLEKHEFQNRKEKEVVVNREKQFTSQISTLPGPSSGLNAVKVQNKAEKEQDKKIEVNKHIS